MVRFEQTTHVYIKVIPIEYATVYEMRVTQSVVGIYLHIKGQAIQIK